MTSTWLPRLVFLLIFTVCLADTSRAELFSEGLIAYYPLNGNANDTSGLARHAQAMNLVYEADRHNSPGTAGDFHEGAFIVLPPALVTNAAGAGPLSVSMWIKLNPSAGPIGSINALVLGNSQVGQLMTIGVSTHPSQQIRIQYSHYFADEVWSNDPILTDKWTHVAATVATNGEVALYVDGAASGSGRTSPRRGDSLGLLGKGLSAGSQWDGHIDDVRIYSRLLGPQEMASLYQYENNPVTASRSARATARVVNGFVVELILEYGGQGYTIAPAVRLTGGGGSGATASAVITDGRVSGLTVTSTGGGYSSAPTVEMDPPPTVPRRAVANAEVVNGFVVGVTLVDPGEGYTAAPIVRFEGGGGTGGAAVAEVSNGSISAIRITSTGSGYVSAPIVVIGRPSGSPELAIAVSRVKVSLGLVPGRKYSLESSLDFRTWIPVDVAFVAESETIEREFAVDQTWRYFRILEVP